MDNEVIDAEFEVTESLVPAAPTALESMSRAECMTQVDVAKRYPRAVAKFKSTIQTLALSSQAIAEKCFYTLPGRSGTKPVSGPSIRMAEMMAAAWGNLAISTALVEISDRTVTVRARVWDMERNIAHQEEFVAPIVGSANKGGHRYSDDMIAVTIRAAQAKARRNAILAIVPRAYYEEIKPQIMLVAAGKGMTLRESAAKAMAYWKDEHGVTTPQVLKALRRDTVDEITAEDVAFLRGFVTAVKEGQPVETIFGPPMKAGDDLVEKLGKRDQRPAGEEAKPADLAEEAMKAEEREAKKKGKS
jgi:hypothetical protein